MLPEQIAFDPNGDFDAFLARVPGRWAVYLLRDEEGRPFHLLSVRNLRASLANRLSEHPQDERTRAIAYRQVVRGVQWQRVDSVAEAEWVYLQCAKSYFPQTARTLLANWEPWFVQVDPAAEFPRWTATTRVDEALAETTFGPISTKEKAAGWVEIIEDAFDLCRYHHILTQAPHGQACAYKQMHKCPAPCDGSISMAMYHQLIDQSILAARSTGEAEAQELRMREAAGAMRFEQAGKIKQYVDQLQILRAGPYGAMCAVAEMNYLAVLPGGGARKWKLMRMSAEEVALLGEVQSQAEAEALLGRKCPPEGGNREENLKYIARRRLMREGDCRLTDGSSAAISEAMKSLSRRKATPTADVEGLDQETGSLGRA